MHSRLRLGEPHILHLILAVGYLTAVAARSLHSRNFPPLYSCSAAIHPPT